MFIDDACISPLKLRSAANEEIVGTCFRFREVVLTADHCVRDDGQLLPGTFIAWDKQLIYRGSLETMDVAVFSEEVTSTNSFQSFASAKEGELVQARGSGVSFSSWTPRGGGEGGVATPLRRGAFVGCWLPGGCFF